MRYISHELRTPLNAATLGLKLVMDELQNKPEILNEDHPSVPELVETLADSQYACSVGVNILNDLLNYDKLQSGLMELHKENIVVMPFVTECVKMFHGQARAKDVELAISFQGGSRAIINGPSSSYLHSPLSSQYPAIFGEVNVSDNIFGDRFKLEQVLRNLISNAVKFSPPGSKIQILTYFKHQSSLHQTTSGRRHSFVKMVRSLSSRSPNADKTRQNRSPSSIKISSRRLLQHIDSSSTGLTQDVSHVSSAAFQSATPAQDPNALRLLEDSPTTAVYMDPEVYALNSASKHDELQESFQSISYSQRLAQSEDDEIYEHIHNSDDAQDMLVIKVIDNGPGISKVNQMKLFIEAIQFDPEILQVLKVTCMNVV